MYNVKSKSFNYSIMIILLFMILSRITWTQLREFDFIPSSRAVSTYELMNYGEPLKCLKKSELNQLYKPQKMEHYIMKNDSIDFHLWNFDLMTYYMIKYLCFSENPSTEFIAWQGLMLYIIVLSCLLLIRTITSSWILSLVGAATLLSRGALIERIGFISDNLSLTAFLTLAIVAQYNFHKTGSWYGLFAFVISVALCSLINLSFFFLFLITFIVYLIKYISIKGKPDSKIQNSLKKLGALSASPFSLLPVPFKIWMIYKNNFRKTYTLLFVSFLVVSIFCFFLVTPMKLPTSLIEGRSNLDHLNLGSIGSFIMEWYSSFHRPLDLHYMTCISLLFLWGFSCRDIPFARYKPLLQWILINFLTLNLGFLLLQYYKLSHMSAFTSHATLNLLIEENANQVLQWFEPLVISLGLISFFELIKLRLKRT